MVVGNNESATTKNAGKLLVISIAVRMWRYDPGRIAPWNTSRASLRDTGCRHQARVPAPYHTDVHLGQQIC